MIIKELDADERIEKLLAEVARLKPYEMELRRIAEAVGEKDDPFAAWEVIDLMIESRKSTHTQRVR